MEQDLDLEFFDDESSDAPQAALAIGSFFNETLRKASSSKTSKQRKNGHGMTREQLMEYERSREHTTVATFARLDASEESMLHGDRRAIQLWLADAGSLVEDFRVTRQLFLSDRVSVSTCTTIPELEASTAYPVCEIPWSGRGTASKARSP